MVQLFFRQPMQRVRKLWWARRSVSYWHARGLHVTQSYRTVSSTSALSTRILTSREALCQSYSLKMYFRKLHQELLRRRSTSMSGSPSWLTFSPRYTSSFFWFYTLAAASTLNMAVPSGIPFGLKQIISVLASDMVRPNGAHTATITPIILGAL